MKKQKLTQVSFGEFSKFLNRFQYVDDCKIKISHFKYEDSIETWYAVDNEIVAEEATTWYYGNFAGSIADFYIKEE